MYYVDVDVVVTEAQGASGGDPFKQVQKMMGIQTAKDDDDDDE